MAQEKTTLEKLDYVTSFLKTHSAPQIVIANGFLIMIAATKYKPWRQGTVLEIGEQIVAEQKALAEDKMITKLFERHLQLKQDISSGYTDAPWRLSVVEKVEKSYNVMLSPELEKELVDARLLKIKYEDRIQARSNLGPYKYQPTEAFVSEYARVTATEKSLTTQLRDSYTAAFKDALSKQANKPFTKGIAEALREAYVDNFVGLTQKAPAGFTANNLEIMSHQDFVAFFNRNYNSADQLYAVVEEINGIADINVKKTHITVPGAVASNISKFENFVQLSEEAISLSVRDVIKNRLRSFTSGTITRCLGWGLIFAGAAWSVITYYLDYTHMLDATADNSSAREAFITLLNPENDIPEDVKKAAVDTVPDVDTYINPFYTAIRLGKAAEL